MDLLQEHFEFQQPLVQVDGRVRDVQKVSGYIFRRIWKNSGFVEYYQFGGLFSSETELRTERRIDSISVDYFRSHRRSGVHCHQSLL